ncbi:hypothetical protein [Azospirillum argentinense]|uniref:Uncharacterized protein n=1 Tax=Azospirillum brasilense TaxID=192 RepID=A0A4D8QDD6_AZOBR|nr:hypothetical protein [Azospirillum argentinense]QCO07291.1 hypothetical protein D3867_36025 [Azospirillum argentinense]
MSRPSLPITEAEARRPDPAVEAAALALVKAMAEAGLAGEFLDITAVLTPREGGVCRRVRAGISVVIGDPEEFEDA